MKVGTLPLREELEALARHYHHLQVEHQSLSPESSPRRHVEDKLLSAEALQALADFLERGDPPPWEHASELLADGLIDLHFALTPRGHRALRL